MKNYSNTYIFVFSAIMVLVVAALLSFAALKLAPIQERNVEIEKKRNILSSLRIESTADNADDIYDEYVTKSYVINNQGELLEGVDAFEVNIKEQLGLVPDERKLPVYVGELEDGTTHYVFPVRGKGLWGPIWGYVALNEDYSTIYGANFDHQGETPGLGAEINTDAFEQQFIGKELFNEQGEFVSIEVVKGNAPPDAEHKVDGISGGTITSKGVQEMLYDVLGTYVSYFKSKKQLSYE